MEIFFLKKTVTHPAPRIEPAVTPNKIVKAYKCIVDKKKSFHFFLKNIAYNQPMYFIFGGKKITEMKNIIGLQKYKFIYVRITFSSFSGGIKIYHKEDNNKDILILVGLM